tara:strand:+ start:8291 stop:8875 length:585 start_codon:yes stop_codon:yes gene_type:complete
MFDNQRDASMRLSGTVIRGPNGPVRIENFFNKDEFTYYEIGPLGRSPDEKRGALSSGLFCIKAFPLGYINHKGASIYICRMPHRRYKQGLSKEAVYVDPRTRVDISTLLSSGGFYRMFSNEYPTFYEAVGSLFERDIDTLAFHREWAVENRREGRIIAGLLYKGKEVGVFSEEEGFELNKKYEYLNESLEEAVQ